MLKLLSQRIACMPHRAESSHVLLSNAHPCGSSGMHVCNVQADSRASMAWKMRSSVDSSFGVVLARTLCKT
eukprot:382448-Rhodomonas_salina.1